ncbi:protein NDRG3-like [Liolophura sinensis]|uniref:protein NDRG3-like n=1 Tax=Liolophura sinensis TaxID=3198878 RepID=UPI003158C648
MESRRLLDWNGHDDEDRPMEKLTDIELTSISSTSAEPRRLLSDANNIIIQDEDVETPHGRIRVAIQGDRTKPAILTFHDIGLNHISCYQGFFSFPEMQPILRHFCVYHLDAPGQEEGALQLKQMFMYPTMDQLAQAVYYVIDYFGIKRVLGFGVGAGANVLTRLALQQPNRVDALVLINPTAKMPGWIEWGYQKMNSWYLFGGQMTNFTEEYLLWHWFGKKTRWQNHDLVHVFQDYIKVMNAHNLSLFIESYIKRDDLGVVRELDPIKKSVSKAVKCRTLILVGDDSPHIDEVVDMNGRMDPQETDFMKIADCGGMPLDEQPGKVCEAFKLFLQGMGYVPALKQTSSVASKARQQQQAEEMSQIASGEIRSPTVC